MGNILECPSFARVHTSTGIHNAVDIIIINNEKFEKNHMIPLIIPDECVIMNKHHGQSPADVFLMIGRVFIMSSDIVS